jgi:hypothetical protein
MPLTARRYLRKMRGGAQAHLLEADDGHSYIVKCQNNPQHRRVLVNELVAAVLLKYLQVSSPETALIRVGADFLADNPEVHLTLGSRRVPVAPGWHFGSQFPGDPSRLAVYDFLPDALLGQVTNLADYRGILVFDKWASNADGRQSIFFRARVEDWSPLTGTAPPRVALVAVMVDHGFVFDGPNWDFRDAPLQGLYARRLVYEPVRSLDDFQPWLDQVRHFPEEILDAALRQVPPAWVAGEEDEFERVLERLWQRRKLLPELIEQTRRASSNPFPNWR